MKRLLCLLLILFLIQSCGTKRVIYNNKPVAVIEVKKTKKDFHVVKTVIEYKKPIIYDQIIDAGVTISNIGNSSINFNISLFANKKNTLFAKANIIQVYTDQIKKSSTQLCKRFIS